VCNRAHRWPSLLLCTADAEVPYHNFHHAVDVTVSSYLILTACDARAHMKPIDAFALMMAAIGHDAGHPGLTNGPLPASAPCVQPLLCVRRFDGHQQQLPTSQ